MIAQLLPCCNPNEILVLQVSSSWSVWEAASPSSAPAPANCWGWFSGSQELSGSLCLTQTQSATNSFQTGEKLWDLMSLKVRCGLFERQQLLCSLFFHYLEFRENQEQLDFTQTHKLTVLHCVTPSVFLKIPPLMQRRSESMLWSFCSPLYLWHHLPHYFAMYLLPRCTF